MRRRLSFESRNRAYPPKRDGPDSLLAKRYELARLLGYRTWAEYVTEDKMIRTPKRVAEFVDRVAKLVSDQSKREYAVYLKRKRLDDPQAAHVENWESNYYGNLIRKSDFDFDAQAVRPYFAFENVKRGMLDITSIFGVTYKRIDDAVVWHPSVEAASSTTASGSSAASSSTCTRGPESTTMPPNSRSDRDARDPGPRGRARLQPAGSVLATSG